MYSKANAKFVSIVKYVGDVETEPMPILVTCTKQIKPAHTYPKRYEIIKNNITTTFYYQKNTTICTNLSKTYKVKIKITKTI